jgi:Zn-dependent M28 family amino/carboxypeptidase
MTDDRQIRESLERHVRALAVEIGPRSPLMGHGLLHAERYVRIAFESAGLTVQDQRYEYFGRAVSNLVAQHRQSGESTPHYVIGAHYDSVPNTPGADDNASAVAVMLTLAERTAGLSLPVRFAAFTLEEPPAFATRHQGSRMYLRRHRPDLTNIKGAIILEMVGYTSAEQHYPLALKWAGYPKTGDFIGIIANRRSRKLLSTVARGLRRNPKLPVETLRVPFNGWVLPATRLSDHASFWDAGCPAVMVTDTAFMRNPHYHMPSDKMDTLDFEFMTELVVGLEYALDELESRATQK